MTTAIPGMKVTGPRTDLEEWAQLSHWADVGHPFLLAQKREAQPGGWGSDFISTESVRSHFSEHCEGTIPHAPKGSDA